MKRKLNRVKGMSRVLTAAFFTALIAASGSSSGLRHETAPLPTSINPAIGTNVQIASPPAVPLAKEHEAISLFGVKLVSPAPNPAALQRYEQARRDFTAAPTEDNYVWLGRRPPAKKTDLLLIRTSLF
jgi:hypothetical protein